MTARRSRDETATLPDVGAWLPGFGWAVPSAFSSAVAACRFEQGDVLYADQDAYGDWAEGPPGRWLQILDPPRSARARSSEGDANRFVSSWGSPVTLELGEAGPGKVDRVETTQGRLFTCLWTSDLGAIRSKRAPDPPVLLVDLQRRLESALPHMREALSAAPRAHGSAHSPAVGSTLFVAGLDLASDVSLSKAESIWAALSAEHGVRVHDASPAECGVPDGGLYHPTLVVRGIAVDGASEEQVTQALKGALYTPQKAGRGVGAESSASGADEAGAEGEAPVRADRFLVSRHGWLGPLEPEPELEASAEADVEIHVEADV